MQDVRIVEALYRSAKIGRTVSLPVFTKRRRPSLRQEIVRPGIRKPAVSRVESPHQE